MPTLNEKLELGAALFTQPRDLGERRVYGTATAASSGGNVSVDVGGETVTIPTVGAVTQGDEVVIQVQNGHPVAIGSRGWGDNVRDAITDMQDTLSYVWLDEYGQLRITPEPQWEDPTTGVMINANGVNVVGYTYASHTGDNGFSVVMGNSPVIQMLGYAQQPDFQHNILRSTDVLMLDADDGGADPSVLYDDRTRLSIVEQTAANTYYGGDVLMLDVDGNRVFSVSDTGDVSATSVSTSGLFIGGDRIASKASAGTLGAVKVGDGLSIDSGGTLSWDGMTILSYGHSTWQDFIDAYNANRVVYCRASSNSNPGTGAQTRMAFMAYVNADPPTNVEFQYYRSVSSHSATQQGDQVYIYKLTNTGTWSVTVREASVQVVADTGLTRAYASNKLTIGLDDTGWTNVATGIRARVVGKMMTVVAIGYTTDTTSGWATVGTLPASVTGGAVRFLACKYSDGTTRRGEIDGNTLKLHQPGTAIGLEFTVTVPVG